MTPEKGTGAGAREGVGIWRDWRRHGKEMGLREEAT